MELQSHLRSFGLRERSNVMNNASEWSNSWSICYHYNRSILWNVKTRSYWPNPDIFRVALEILRSKSIRHHSHYKVNVLHVWIPRSKRVRSNSIHIHAGNELKFGLKLVNKLTNSNILALLSFEFGLELRGLGRIAGRHEKSCFHLLVIGFLPIIN